MEYGICHLTFIPMRAEPSEKSEMVSQVLFGEQVEIIEREKSGRYVMVKNLFDDYEGWCVKDMFTHIEEIDIRRILTGKIYITRDILSILMAGDGVSRLYLGAGSTLAPSDDNTIKVNSVTYRIPDSFYQIPVRSKRENILAAAKKFTNIPYLWGGRSSFGTDCSGFVQNIFKQSGIPLPRDAKQQAECGKMITSIEETHPGDLLFFNDDKGDIIHTGIYAGNKSIIHASGRVKQNAVDKEGIIPGESKKYSHKLYSIRRILDEV